MPLVTGGHLQIMYDASKIEADPITIQVVSPDGQTTETKFDLATLR